MTKLRPWVAEGALPLASPHWSCAAADAPRDPRGCEAMRRGCDVEPKKIHGTIHKSHRFLMISGWWLTYPSEKYSSIGMMTSPIYGKTKVIFQSTPTRFWCDFFGWWNDLFVEDILRHEREKLTIERSPIRRLNSVNLSFIALVWGPLHGSK